MLYASTNDPVVKAPGSVYIIGGKTRSSFMKSNTTIVWVGTLAILLARLKRKPYEVIHIKHDESKRIKRLGVYYMCIDDLPL